MRVVVPVKYTPDPNSTWTFNDDFTVNREVMEGYLSELDEYPVEQAVRLFEGGWATSVTVLTMGPQQAVDGIRKALAMGGEVGVHVLDDALHGSDALATSRVLARAIERIGFDLVVCGISSTDAEMSVIPTMIAERLGVPCLSLATELSTDPSTSVVTIQRNGDLAWEELTAPLPAVVSVSDQSGEPRYPAFRSIMTARKKPVTTWSLRDLDIDAAEVGAVAAKTRVVSLLPKPPRQAGTIMADGDGAAAQLADFLSAQGLV